jgi:hypothetical protein
MPETSAFRFSMSLIALIRLSKLVQGTVGELTIRILANSEVGHFNDPYAYAFPERS